MSLHLFSLSASSAWVFAAVFLTMVLAGVVKGTVGFGLPLISVSVLANVIDVRLALALVTIPIVISNLWLAWQGREVVATLRRFWLVILAIGVGIFLGSSLTARVDGRALMLILGCTVIVFALFEKFRPGEHASLPPALVTPLGAVAGLTGGILGGLSTAYGPPLIMYLTTLRMPKERFVAAVGTIWAWLLNPLFGTTRSYKAYSEKLISGSTFLRKL